MQKRFFHALHHVRPGVVRIDLPLPFELPQINVYAISLGPDPADGYMLIDTGFNTPDSLEVLEQALAAAAIPWEAIRILFITHCHPDHTGLAPLILARSGAELYMNAAEASQLAGLASLDPSFDWMRTEMDRAGLPPALSDPLEVAIERLRGSLPVLTPHRTFSGGESISTCLGPLVAHFTPGHSPGHLCLHSPDTGVYFAGDHLLGHITPNIHYHPTRDLLAEYLDSLDSTAALSVESVLPAHGAPFGSHAARAGAIKAHHARRLAGIAEAIGSKPSSVFEIVLRIWRKELAPIQYRFAVFEVLAHLEYMRRRGQAAIEEAAIPLWRALPAR